MSVESWLAEFGNLPTDFIPAEIVIAELSEVQRELEQRQECAPKAVIQFTDDRYQFLEEIARGGAAVVCRVRDNHLQREIAIKFLLDSHDNRDMRYRLERGCALGWSIPELCPFMSCLALLTNAPL